MSENGPDVSLDLLITPVSSGAERQLRYDDWQLAKARKVDELSGGRLGYLHIRSMGGPDLVEYERDLYAAAAGKEGLLIDVRSNGGGWTTDLVLASLMYPRHAFTIPRGADPIEGQGYPQDRLYIQRFNGPVNMLSNEKSFSNAEIISHAFKTLGRGTLVGQETHGSVISTGAFTLVDGTRVRQPFRGWYLLDGTDMENNGAVPDIIVEQTPEDEAAGLDRQLEAAVEDLLKRLD
jgi:tricorn protease